MLSALQTRLLVCAAFIFLFTIYRFHQTNSDLQIWPTGALPPPSGAQISSGLDNTLAAYLSPAELMARPLPGSKNSIPKLFHQSWSSKNLPTKFARWSETCRRMHPDWEWVLWTDDDNRELVERYVPGMMKAYQDLRGPIFRADIVRNAYLHLFGGVYADLDMECLRPADELFSNFSVSTHASSRYARSIDVASVAARSSSQKAFVGRMGTDNGFEHSIPNAWMASPPGHPFFKLMLQWATKKITSGDELDSRPEAVTGPIALRDGIERFKKGRFGWEALTLPEIFSEESKTVYTVDASWEDASVEVLPFHYIYPYSWHRDGDMFREHCWSTLDSFNAEKCKGLVAVDRWPSWTITYWSHTWNGDGPNAGNLKKIEEAKG